MAWRHEDGGPRRTALVPGGLHLIPADRLVTTFLALTRVEVVTA